MLVLILYVEELKFEHNKRDHHWLAFETALDVLIKNSA